MGLSTGNTTSDTSSIRDGSPSPSNSQKLPHPGLPSDSSFNRDFARAKAADLPTLILKSPRVLPSDNWQCMNIWSGLSLPVSPTASTVDPNSKSLSINRMLETSDQVDTVTSWTTDFNSNTPCANMRSESSAPDQGFTISSNDSKSDHGLFDSDAPQTGRFALINARSATAHASDIYDLLDANNLDLLAVTETWFKQLPTILLEELMPQNYTIMSKPRPTRAGGGVAFIAKQSLSLTQSFLPSEPNTFEYIMAKARGEAGSTITFVCIYHPPGEESKFLDELQVTLEDLVAHAQKIVLCGDFNIHFGISSDPFAVRLDTILSNLEFVNYLSESTHKLGNQLDLVLQRNVPLSYAKASILPWADHKVISAIISDWTCPVSSRKAPTISEKIAVRALKLLTPEKFSQFWISCTNSSLDADELDAILHTKLTLARNTICPLRWVQKKTKLQRMNRWFTQDIQALRTQGRALEKKWRKHRRRQDLLAYQRHRHRFKLAIKQAKRQYIQQQLGRAGNSSKILFKLTKDLLASPSQSASGHLNKIPSALCENIASFFQQKIQKIRGSIETSLANHSQAQSLSSPFSAKKLADIPALTQAHKLNNAFINKPPLLEHFSLISQEDILKVISGLGPSSSPLDPLATSIIKSLAHLLVPDITILINKSLETGIVPIAWKKGIVTPLLKKPDLDPEVLNNNRPVTQLRLLTRICENVVTQQIQAQLETNGLLHDAQSGFRPLRGTELAVTDMREILLRKADDNHPTALVLLDLSAAFDTVDHAILLNRLRDIAGLEGAALAWCKSFLTNRSQQVRIDDTWSSPHTLAYGVPQGSAISPIMFNIYLRPLATVIESHGLKFQMYADDIQLLVDLHPSSKDAEHLIPCLEAIQAWMSSNYLMLNGEKTEILLSGCVKGAIPPSCPWPASWGAPPIPVLTVKNLGITLNHQLSSKTHAGNTIRACNMQLNLLTHVFPYLDLEQKTALYHAYVGSRLSHGAYIYLGAPAHIIKSLQRVQNRAIRLIFQLRRREKLSPWRRRLNWLKVDTMIQFRTCQRIWRILNSQGPGYTRAWINSTFNCRPTRTATRQIIHPIKCKKTFKGGMTFGFKGAQIWNSLPSQIRSAATFDAFKRTLRIHLLNRDGSIPPASFSIDMGNSQSHEQKRPSRPTPPSGTFSQTEDLSATRTPSIQTAPVSQQAPGSHQLTLVRPKPTTLSRPPHPPAHSMTSPPDKVADRRLGGQARTWIWGLSSPPLPQRNNPILWARMIENKKRRYGRIEPPTAVT